MSDPSRFNADRQDAVGAAHAQEGPQSKVQRFALFLRSGE
jgi:hypothetical protein